MSGFLSDCPAFGQAPDLRPALLDAGHLFDLLSECQQGGQILQIANEISTTNDFISITYNISTCKIKKKGRTYL